MNLLLPLLCLSVGETPLDASYLRNHAETRGFMLGRPVKPKPTPDGKAVLFLRSEARAPKLKLYEFDVATGKTRELLSPQKLLQGAAENLSAEEKARRERMRVSVGGFTDYQLSEDGSLILLSLSGKLYVFDRGSGKVHELKTGPGTLLDPKFSPDGKKVAYVRNYDAHVYDLATDKEHAVTTGGTEKKSHGLAEFVAQEEMDRYSGYWWSPESKFIAYEEADADGVEIWYVADPAKPEQPPLPTYYPRPGKKNVQVRLGVVPVEGGKTVWIDWNEKKYPYLARVNWKKEGPMTIVVQNRLQNELILLNADPANGKTTEILNQRNSTWVNLRNDVPHWYPDGKAFFWVGETPAGPELEVRRADGKLEYILVPSSAGFQRLIDFEQGKDLVHYLASKDPTESQVVSRAILGFGVSWPTEVEQGLQDAVFSKNHQICVITTTTPESLPHSQVFVQGPAFAATFVVNKLGSLPSVAADPGFKPKVQFAKLLHGGALYVGIVRPRNFDSRKKYPVIVDVYGGPGHQHVLAAMRNWLLPQWLADQGFIVVSIDNRGTPGRGRDWERAIYKKFASVPLDDQIAGLQALGKKFPELDLDRVGIVGWSFGGYMSALAVLKRPDVFKAAVAGAPVTDWEDYDTHYTERYLGLPQDNPQVYKEASLLTYAADLKRPLLLVHGTADDNVYFRHTLKLTDALFRAGKEFEVLPLSGLTHMVPDPVVTERLWTRIAGHFKKHLGEPKK